MPDTPPARNTYRPPSRQDQLHIRLRPDTRERLREHCERHYLTATWVIQKAVEQYLEREVEK